jgi:glycosyltransferase involved in cell wall biosynthesis
VRILHVIGSLAPRYGGPSGWVPQLAAQVAKRGHEVEIVTTNADVAGTLDVPLGRAIDWAGAPTTFHPLSTPRRFITSWSMLADLRRRVRACDVVHIHGLYRFHSIVASMVARRRQVPYVIQPHGALDPWHRGRGRRAKDLYHLLVEDPIIRGASAIVCTSGREEQSIRDLGYRGPTWVIPGAIDADALREPAAPSLLEQMGIHPDARVVTFLGRISAKKGVPLLVESFGQTAEEFPDAHLIIAGPDDEGIGQRLASLITQAGLADRVSFMGLVAGPEKRALLQRSDVFVLPSADESFGSAVVEAMAVGCPVIVSPQVAIEDVVRESGAGLVAERNVTDIARAVHAILADPGAALAMAEAGRRVVDSRFAWPTVADEFEAMYEAVIANQGRRVRSERAS